MAERNFVANGDEHLSRGLHAEAKLQLMAMSYKGPSLRRTHFEEETHLLFNQSRFRGANARSGLF